MFQKIPLSIVCSLFILFFVFGGRDLAFAGPGEGKSGSTLSSVVSSHTGEKTSIKKSSLKSSSNSGSQEESDEDTSIEADAGEEKKDIDTNEDEEKSDLKVQKELKEDINSTIRDLIIIPKANQVIRELSTQLTKKIPNDEDRIKAYESIKRTLILRGKRTQESLDISDNGKYLLKEYTDTMIKLLDKKIEELK